MANNELNTKVVTGLVRFSYVHIFEPTAIDEGSDEKYSLSVIIPKSDKATLKKIKEAIEAAKEQGRNTVVWLSEKGQKWQEKQVGKKP